MRLRFFLCFLCLAVGAVLNSMAARMNDTSTEQSTWLYRLLFFEDLILAGIAVGAYKQLGRTGDWMCKLIAFVMCAGTYVISNGVSNHSFAVPDNLQGDSDMMKVTVGWVLSSFVCLIILLTSQIMSGFNYKNLHFLIFFTSKY